MQIFQDKTDFSKHILIRNLIDLEFLEPYIEVALRRKIYPFVPKTLVEDILANPTDNEDLILLLKKAVAHYTIPIAIPMIKVTLTNTGIQNFKDGELQNSQWWDVRDMALQCATVADEALNDLVDDLLLTPYKSQLTFLDKFNSIIFNSPSEFYDITQLGGGYDAFMNLLPSIQHVWELIIKEKFPACVFDDFKNNAELYELLKKATAFYAASEAVGVAGLVFTHAGVFIQWEQLPWQKSALLNENQLSTFRKTMIERANKIMQLIWDLIKKTPEDYHCLEDFNNRQRPIIVRKSGLYF